MAGATTSLRSCELVYACHVKYVSCKCDFWSVHLEHLLLILTLFTKAARAARASLRPSALQSYATEFVRTSPSSPRVRDIIVSAKGA